MDEFIARLSQPLLKRIISLLPRDVPVYLVGGAVRDALISRRSYDLDFVTGGDAMHIARNLADELGGAYFPLDMRRKVARLVLKLDHKAHSDGPGSIRVDFSAFQGANLEADLTNRDFTINAMAVEVHRLDTLLDPTGGAADLATRRLRACLPGSFLNDPVRVLRAVRFSVDLELNLMPETLRWMREASPHLARVSAERLRDELFRMLVIAHPSTSLRIMDMLGALEFVVPEVCMLKSVQQSQPHVLDAWNHTLDTLNRLENVLEALSVEYSPDKADNLILGLVVLRLGKHRQQLTEHLKSALNPDRPHRGLIFLAGLYHDVGKKTTQTVDETGKIRFFDHDQLGSKMVEKRGHALRLSNLEINRLVTIVKHHMRPSLLSHPEEAASKKAVYRFFRDTGAAGVDICLLSLADMLATYGPTLPQERWDRHLELVGNLLSAWWEDRKEAILPKPLVSGNELMRALKLSPGPLVGYLLESIREAQINNEVHDQPGAINLAQKLLVENNNKKTG